MSLLMEALKKAEQAKRLTGANNAPGSAPAATPELTLTPLAPALSAPAASPGSPLPELSLHIDSLDADLAAITTEAPAGRRAAESVSPTSAPDAREASERAAARNVFAAKQRPGSRTLLWLVLGLSAIVVLGFGAYFWWQMQSVSGSSLALPAQAQTSPRSLPPTAATQGPAATVREAGQPQPEILTPPGFSALRPAPETPARFDAPARAQRPSAAGPAALDSAVRLSKNQPRVNQTLERAYEALQAGQLEDAQRDYEQVLRGDAKNTDALLGLATIAARQGQTERAQGFYLRALESDPNDATAQAGLINTRGQADPGLSESRLKTALTSQPDSPALHFALGNLYARQARWSEAQQAYFRAYSAEPDNADFIFNLAVSLDHLHQNKLAAQYYQMALNAAAGNNASFDRSQVKNRILELQP